MSGSVFIVGCLNWSRPFSYNTSLVHCNNIQAIRVITVCPIAKIAYAAEEACSKGCDCEVIDVIVVSAAFRIVLKLVLGIREITNWKTEEKRRALWRLQRRACHDRVVVMLLAGTEVSVDWELFPHFLRVRRGVGVRRSLASRLPRRRRLLLRIGPDSTSRLLALREDALSPLQCLRCKITNLDETFS